MPHEHVVSSPFPLNDRPGDREIPNPEIPPSRRKQGRKNPGERMIPPGCSYVQSLRDSLQRPEDGPKNSL